MTPGLDRRKRAALPTSIFAGELKALTVWQWATSAGARIPIPRLLPFVMQPKAINISTARPGPKVGFPTPSSARWRNCLSRWNLAVSGQLAGATISKPWRSLKPRTAVSNKGDQSKSAKSSGRNEFQILKNLTRRTRLLTPRRTYEARYHKQRILPGGRGHRDWPKTHQQNRL